MSRQIWIRFGAVLMAALMMLSLFSCGEIQPEETTGIVSTTDKAETTAKTGTTDKTETTEKTEAATTAETFLKTDTTEATETTEITETTEAAERTETETVEATTEFENREITVSPTHELISYIGRYELSDEGHLLFNNTAAGFEICFFGTKLEVTMYDTKNTAIVAVLIDGQTDPTKINLNLGTDGVLQSDGTRLFTLCEFEEPGLHTVRVQKITEEHLSRAALAGVTVTGKLMTVENDYKLKMMVYGDSISAGAGNVRAPGAPDILMPQNGLLTYAVLAGEKLNADVHVFARSGMGLYTNPCAQITNLEDIYGKVSPYSEKDWDMSSWIPDVVVINMGTNDYVTNESNVSAGNVIFDAEQFKAHYVDLVKKLYAAYGEDTVFVLCSGLMETELASYVKDVTAILVDDGINAHQIKFTKCPSGHPRVSEHRAAASQLAMTVSVLLMSKK